MKNMSKNQKLDLQKFEALISHMKFLELKYGLSLATSPKENEAFQLIPLYSFNKLKLRDELFEYAIEKALETGLVKKGDRVIITGASAVGNAVTDTIKLHIL